MDLARAGCKKIKSRDLATILDKNSSISCRLHQSWNNRLFEGKRHTGAPHGTLCSNSVSLTPSHSEPPLPTKQPHTLSRSRGMFLRPSGRIPDPPGIVFHKKIPLSCHMSALPRLCFTILCFTILCFCLADIRDFSESCPSC